MSGKIIPKILIKELNEKKYKDLKEEFKTIIKQCFKSLNNDDTIKIKRLHTSNKGIFKLTVNKEFCYVYLLYKKDEIIYENNVYNFCDFLKKIKVDNEIIEKLYFYHWGDNSYNNSGKKRYCFKEIYSKNPLLIKQINLELNKLKIFEIIVNEVLFSDNRFNNLINYILVNEKEKWFIYDKKQTLSILLNKNYNYNTHIHIGPFSIQNKCRNLNFDTKKEKNRKNIILKWYDFKDIMILKDK